MDPEIQTRINAYEMAFRMQASVPELMDLSREPQHVLDMYGTQGSDGSYAANCLLARRLAERGVRFIHPLPPRMGPPRRSDIIHEDLLRAHRQAHLGAVDRPQATGPFGGYAGHLGR